MAEQKTGGCLCGAVRFHINGPLQPVVVCHCSQCRRQTGSGWMSSDCADADLEITHDKGLAWFHASPTAKRGFCKNCGSTLFWKGYRFANTSVSVGTLDEASGVTTGMHIFVANKGDSYEITDGVVQFAQGHG